ncbi:hypothetical protein BKA59DRAFT_541465 [Fusarium tricinctum]|uniref:Uncharacterized protein n=1 Tax=Fusarium tricinctum TaxID=61284 RepID=A0A8K0S029_9HYPO|nr:hypothetical protein BKA59DRAFT_541465 [Fusarium tricinctum]
MAIGSFMRSLLRGCFSSGDISDTEKQTKYPHLRGGEYSSKERCSTRRLQKFPGANKTWRGSGSGSDHKSWRDYMIKVKVKDPGRIITRQPLPVVPRKSPPQQQQQQQQKALLPLHDQNHNVQQQDFNVTHSHTHTHTREREAEAETDSDETHVHVLTQQPTESIQTFISHDRSMNREAVSEVIDMIALRFSHIPYAVSGLAAMVYYGYDARPYKVSIICPEHTRENQKCWAKAQGMIPIPRRSDIWGLATTDGIVHQIRVRFPYDFEDMHALKIGSSAVSMLSLAGLADELARTYVNELKHSDHARQDNLAREMVWILQRIIQVRMPEHMLTPERIPRLTKETFWLPFSLAYPETVPLFAKAGWRIPSDGWI